MAFKFSPQHFGGDISPVSSPMDTPLLPSGVSGPSGGGEGAGGHGRGCGRCGKAFSIFFNKRVNCGGGCDLAVCRKCATWSAADKSYVCTVCSNPPQPQESPTAPDNPSPGGVSEVEAGIRCHIESLAESLVGGPLDHVSASPNTICPHHVAPLDLSKISEHNKWDLLLYYYCFCHDRPLPQEDIPTARHTQLSERIGKVLQDAMILPAQTEGYDPAASPETPVEDFNSHTYEDILATAILNKVLESCDGERPGKVTIEVSHDVTSTDTDSGMSGGAKESRRSRHKRGEISEAGSEGSEERSLTPPCHPTLRPTTVSPDQGVVTDDSWTNAATSDSLPLQFKIEEHVEEITTQLLTDEEDQEFEGLDDEVSDSGGSWRGSRCSLDDAKGKSRREKVTHHTSLSEEALLPTLNISLPDPAQISARRVSFPELGGDIINDPYSDTEECEVGPGDMVVDAETWEENWLFRKQKLMGASGSDPVTMLIPNPEAHIPATVGNRDVDELSELSEQQSIGSGEALSMSESEGEAEWRNSYHNYPASQELSTLTGEIVAEFAQQDQEYTVDYSVPSRVRAAQVIQNNAPHTSPHISPHSSQSVQHHSRRSSASHGRIQSVNGHYQERTNSQQHDLNTVNAKSLEINKQNEFDATPESGRPVPKPRKISLSATHHKKSSKSSKQCLQSPSEDLSILSPPIDVPNPKTASSRSDTVWFVETPEDCAVAQGRILRLACQVNTKRPMGLSWYHNGTLIPVDGREQSSWRQGSYHYLNMFSATSATAGTYAAAAYTATDCVWTFCRVLYKGTSRPQKRPAFTKGLSDVDIEEGGELSLQCQVTGHPEPRVVFSRGTERLVSSSRVCIDNDQYGTWTLRITDCSTSESGEVLATAYNSMSSISTQCQVRIFPEGMVQSSRSSINSQGNKGPRSCFCFMLLEKCLCCWRHPHIDDSTPLLLQS